MAGPPADSDTPDRADLCNYGSLGVLNTRPDGLQCHICGEWWTSLAAHTQRTHGLSADEYRATFGLMKKTKLVAPVVREAQSKRATEHLRRIGGPHRETVKTLSTDERRQRALKAERREEHELNSPAPERANPMLEARFGPTKRVPDDVLQDAVNVFVEELPERSRGVWVRTGGRLGVEWSTARMLVYTAADRGMIELSGTRTDLTARHHDGTEIVPPDSFPGRLATLQRYSEATGSAAVPRSAVFEDVAIGKWVESVKNRWRNGTLNDEQKEVLEVLPGWRWPESGPYSGGSVPPSDSEVGVNVAMWNSAFERLGQFVEEHGHARVPARHRDDDGFTLGTWVGAQRWKHRDSELHGVLVQRLERLPGWVWSPPIGGPHE